MCFDFLYKFFWNISDSEKNSAWHIGLYVKYRHACQTVATFN